MAGELALVAMYNSSGLKIAPGNSTVHTVIRSGLLLGGGNIFTAALSFLRNVAIARLISVEDFGIASTFALTMSLVEVSSYMAVDQLVIQARDGDTPRLIAVAHTIQAARGTIGGIVLFLLAQPIAALFAIPHLAWAYGALALLPFLRGLANLDIYRHQRELRFLPTVKVEISAQVVATILAALLAYALGDYRAMLFTLLAQQLVRMLASHIVATQPYRWGWDLAIVRRALRFGWPLLLNGMLMFGILQGDRVVVGGLIGMTELGWFSVAFTLTLMPTMMIAGTFQTFFMPQLARVQDDPKEFARLYIVVVQATILLGASLALFLALAGPSILILVFGEKYEAALSVLVWLSLAQAFRLARTGPVVVAVSKARTWYPTVANAFRIMTLPVGSILVANGVGIWIVVAAAIVGEGLALAFLLVLLNKELSLPLKPLRSSFLTGFIALTLIGLDAAVWPPTASLLSNWHAMQAVLVVAVLMIWWPKQPLRGWVRSLKQKDKKVA